MTPASVPPPSPSTVAPAGETRGQHPRGRARRAVLLAYLPAAAGVAYLALSQPLAWTAYVSGTLLLLWVTGVGVARTRRERAD